MTATDSRDAEFTSNEVESFVEYRPVSRLAIASLLLGILSPTALAHPLLWVVPLVGLILAGLALRRIAASQGELRGSPLAQIGLSMACFFASWAMAWYLTDYFLLARQARQFGESWLQILTTGRVYEAHQLTMPTAQRAKPTDSLADLYTVRPPSPRSDADPKQGNIPGPSDPDETMARELPTMYRQFISELPMSKLMEIGAGWRFAFVRTVSRTVADRYTTYIAQEYDVHYTDHEQPKSLRIVVTLQRTRIDRTAQWYVSRVSTPST